MLHSKVAVSAVLASLAACASHAHPGDGGSWRGASVAVDRTARLFDAIQDEPAAPETEDEGPSFNTFSLRTGGQFIAGFSSELRLDSARFGTGTSISLEDDLGFDSSTQFGRIDVTWRFNRYHAIDVSYFGFKRTASRATEKDIVWGPITIPAGAGVEALFAVDTVKAAYRYTFAVSESWELGGSIGVHAPRLKTGLSTLRLDRSVSYSATLPLPVVGLRGTWEFTPDLRLNGLVDFFYLKLDDVGGLNDFVDRITGANHFEGLVFDGLVSLEYDIVDHVGLGLGFNYFEIDAAAGDDVLELSARYRYYGGLVFVRLFF